MTTLRERIEGIKDDLMEDAQTVNNTDFQRGRYQALIAARAMLIAALSAADAEPETAQEATVPVRSVRKILYSVSRPELAESMVQAIMATDPEKNAPEPAEPMIPVRVVEEAIAWAVSFSHTHARCDKDMTLGEVKANAITFLHIRILNALHNFDEREIDPSGELTPEDVEWMNAPMGPPEPPPAPADAPVTMEDRIAYALEICQPRMPDHNIYWLLVVLRGGYDDKVRAWLADKEAADANK